MTADRYKPAHVQCSACPWRDLDWMRTGPDFAQAALAHAEAGNLDGFVCHTRCTPCPGPRLALKPRRPHDHRTDRRSDRQPTRP